MTDLRSSPSGDTLMPEAAWECTMATVRWLVLGLALSSVGANAETWRNVSKVDGFSGWRRELQRLANTGAASSANHFCIVVRLRQGEDGFPDNSAFVLWREAFSLRSYGQSDEPMGPLTSLGGTMVDLRHDVVESENQINGSIVAVTRAHVANIKRQCAKFGTRLMLKKWKSR